MNITECVPLAGRGLVARRGHLVALTDGMDAGPDPLLTVLTAVAYANGDGAALALAATRAAAERGGRPAWACAGVTHDGQVAVLVHGEAAALVSVDGGPETEVTAGGRNNKSVPGPTPTISSRPVALPIAFRRYRR